ncbi:hypothetical protein, partial [Shewanella sp.]|uniref:hypothetical protein n=1 Tax=Shewanella sp. TaxID=50422 RepID=UPI004047CF2D
QGLTAVDTVSRAVGCGDSVLMLHREPMLLNTSELICCLVQAFDGSLSFSVRDTFGANVPLE